MMEDITYAGPEMRKEKREKKERIPKGFEFKVTNLQIDVVQVGKSRKRYDAHETAWLLGSRVLRTVPRPALE